ncbi:MAG: formylglycine-generating enzyme family protein [bacterium]
MYRMLYLVLVCLCTLWFIGCRRGADKLTTPASSTATQAPVLLPATKKNAMDGAEMILIPAGAFQMGTNEEQLADLLKNMPGYNKTYERELPQHTVQLGTYYIYKTEVTVSQYRTFCTATQRDMPKEPLWKWQDTHPIVNVSWFDAKAYADWAGAALPTEAQWEKTARGGDGRLYPWGNVWAVGKLQCSNAQLGDAKRTAPVGSFPDGASPYGVMDMAGNVWEWCADWYSEQYYKTSPERNPLGPSETEATMVGAFSNEFGSSSGQIERVQRGGDWYFGYTDYFRVSYRGSGVPTEKYSTHGFRCVVPVPEQ